MKRKRVIVIPFNLPWDWSTDYTNQTAFFLGKTDVVICYMWADSYSLKEYLIKKRLPVLIKKFSKNIYLFNPILFIPFRRFPKILKLNEKLNILLLNVFVKTLELKHGIKQKVLWIFDPQLVPFTNYFNKSWKLLYDCVDFFIGTARNLKDRERLIRYEKELCKKADCVFANSKVLLDHLVKIRQDTVLVPQGFRLESFQKSIVKGIPSLKTPGRPLIGFVGAVNSRIDYQLLYSLARKHQEWDIALWGPLLEKEFFKEPQLGFYKKLLKLKNIIRGKSDKSKIPGIIKQFDIGMIPYDPEDDFNKYCYPMKLFEFFYLGKPVVSTFIKELGRFPDLIRIETTVLGWESAVTDLLKKSWPAKLKLKQRNLALENSWRNKVNQIVKFL